MNTHRSLKCLRCLHRDVCEKNDPNDCDHFLPDKNPDLLKHVHALAIYRSEMKKASRQIQGVANFFDNAHIILEKQIQILDNHQYTTPRLKQIAQAIAILQRKLLEEASTIEQKSNFPPQ